MHFLRSVVIDYFAPLTFESVFMLIVRILILGMAFAFALWMNGPDHPALSTIEAFVAWFAGWQYSRYVKKRRSQEATHE